MKSHKLCKNSLIGIIKTGNKERNSNNSVAIKMREKNMKIIEEITLVKHLFDGEVYVNGYEHVADAETSEIKLFANKDSADVYVISEEEAQEICSSSVMDRIEIEVDEVNVERTSESYSIEEMLDKHEWRFEKFLELNPNLEIKEMKCELDGVVSYKKVLVEKELEVA